MAFMSAYGNRPGTAPGTGDGVRSHQPIPNRLVTCGGIGELCVPKVAGQAPLSARQISAVASTS